MSDQAHGSPGILVALGAAILTLATGSAAQAQSSASTYSYGTYNPVQAAINRDSMNAAILRQATGKNSKAGKKAAKAVAKRHKAAG